MSVRPAVTGCPAHRCVLWPTHRLSRLDLITSRLAFGRWSAGDLGTGASIGREASCFLSRIIWGTNRVDAARGQELKRTTDRQDHLFQFYSCNGDFDWIDSFFSPVIVEPFWSQRGVSVRIPPSPPNKSFTINNFPKDSALYLPREFVFHPLLASDETVGSGGPPQGQTMVRRLRADPSIESESSVTSVLSIRGEVLRPVEDQRHAR